MKVSDDLKKAIHEAIVVALNAYAQEEKVDEHLTNAVVAVVEEIPEPQSTPVDLAPVKYIGHRPEYSDGLFNTGVWKQNETRLVPKTVSGQMTMHKGVYVPGDMKDVTGMVQEQTDMGDEAEELQQARDAVMQMTTHKQVLEYVKHNFGNMKVNLPKNARLDEFKQFAIRQIDIQRLP